MKRRGNVSIGFVVLVSRKAAKSQRFCRPLWIRVGSFNGGRISWFALASFGIRLGLSL